MSKDKDRPEDRQGAMLRLPGLPLVRPGETLAREHKHKRTTRNDEVNNHSAEHHLQNNT